MAVVWSKAVKRTLVGMVVLGVASFWVAGVVFAVFSDSQTSSGSVIAACVVEPCEEPPPQGDVSCDGLVNVVDALFILQKEVGQREDHNGCPLPGEPPAEPAIGWLFLAGGDVNKDEVTNVVDALFILQCEVGAKPGANMDFCIAAKSALSVGG